MAMQSGFIKRIRDIMRMDAGINGDAQRIEQMVWMLFLKVYDAKEDDWELNEDDYESIIPEALRWRNWAKADSNGHAMTGDKLLNFVNNVLFPVLKGNLIHANYIVYVLRSPHIDYVVNSVTYGVKMPRVGTETMVNLLIPLPPLAEQKRIVAKIEELLPLCDRLRK